MKDGTIAWASLDDNGLLGVYRVKKPGSSTPTTALYNLNACTTYFASTTKTCVNSC